MRSCGPPSSLSAVLSTAGILTAIQTQLPAIPAAVLAHLDLNIVLDNLSGPDVIDLQALEQSVTEDPDRDVHSELYHLLTQCESDAPEWQTDGNAMLQEAGHQQVEESLQLTRFDLCYNFHRYESWEKVLSKFATICVSLPAAYTSGMPAQCI